MMKREEKAGVEDANEEKKTVKKRTESTKFRKAPQAPKRFKSAFMFFSTEKHPEIRQRLKDGDDRDVPNVAKLVSEEWKKLSPEKRTVWDIKAENDKKRFEFEKSVYTGPWKIPASKRVKKDPDAPKRPMSAFLAFSKKMRAQVKSENSHLINTDVSKLLATKWKEASKEERNTHIEKEAEERAAYKLAIAEWRANQKEKITAERKQREQIALTANTNGTPMRHIMPPNGQGYPPNEYCYGHPRAAPMGGPHMVGQPLQGVPYGSSGYSQSTPERVPGRDKMQEPLHPHPESYPHPRSSMSSSNNVQYWNGTHEGLSPYVPSEYKLPYNNADGYNRTELSQKVGYAPTREGGLYHTNDVLNGSHPYEQGAHPASSQSQRNGHLYFNSNDCYPQYDHVQATATEQSDYTNVETHQEQQISHDQGAHYPGQRASYPNDCYGSQHYQPGNYQYS